MTPVYLFAVLLSIFSCDLQGYVGAVSATYFAFSSLRIDCWRFECCLEGERRSSWVHNNPEKLDKLLTEKLFGQHIAYKILNKQLAGYLEEEAPEKPFVIHISGKTGTGKNHIANLIAQARYDKALESKYVLKIIGTHDWTHLDTRTAQERLRTEVISHVRKCRFSFIVIDEVEKLPLGTLDGISAYLDINAQVDDVDFRNSIFIFLSNTAGNVIRDYVDSQLESGRSRSSLTILEMETLIQNTLYKSGELEQSSILSRYQMDAFIPMLPLERRHVKMCAIELINRRGNKCGCKSFENATDCIESKADAVVAEIDFSGKFSRSGCKKVYTKVNLVCPLDKRDEL